MKKITRLLNVIKVALPNKDNRRVRSALKILLVGILERILLQGRNFRKSCVYIGNTVLSKLNQVISWIISLDHMINVSCNKLDCGSKNSM